MRIRNLLFAFAALALATPAQAAPPVYTGSIAVPSTGNAALAGVLKSCGLGTDASGNVTSNLACFNVKMYGAKGDGVTDDSTAINNAVTAAAAACGVVFLPPGTYYLGSAPIAPATCVWIAGAGVGATKLTLNGALTGGNADAIRFVVNTNGTYLTDVRITDLTIDATNQTQGNGISAQGFNRLTIERVRVLNPFGFGIVVGSVGGATPYSTSLKMDTIWVEGERNGNDSIGGGGIVRGVIQNYYSLNAAGTFSDLTNIQNFTYQNIYGYRSSVPASGADGIDTDFGAQNVTYNGIYIDGAQNGMVISGAAGQNAPTNIAIKNFTIVNVQKNAIHFSSASGKGPVGVDISDGYIGAWNGANLSIQGIVGEGGSGYDLHDIIYAQPTNAAYALSFKNDGGGAAPANVHIHDVDMSALSANFIQLTNIGSGYLAHDNPGYNPLGGNGVVQPSVPASGTAYTNTFGAAATVYLTGGTFTSPHIICGKALPTSTVPAVVVVPPNCTITLFYSAAPSWTWVVN